MLVQFMPEARPLTAKLAAVLLTLLVALPMLVTVLCVANGLLLLMELPMLVAIILFISVALRFAGHISAGAFQRQTRTALCAVRVT
jgi:hypothetical protein